MKVLLINQPNTFTQKPDFPPIGIAYLGAIASREGHETMLIDAGLLVNSYNHKEIGEAIYTLLTNSELRQKLVKKGFEQVKLFAWEKAAKQTLSVYGEVYNS